MRVRMSLIIEKKTHIICKSAHKIYHLDNDHNWLTSISWEYHDRLIVYEYIACTGLYGLWAFNC